MTQSQLDNFTFTLIIVIVLLLIATAITMLVFTCTGIINTDNIFPTQIDNDAVDTLTENPQNNNTIIDLPLEMRYSSVFEWQVYTGDFGIEQLYFLKEQCDKYEIPIEIMLSMICTESSFRSTAKAPTSSAAGYCQIISSTAEWVYERLLNYGEYDVDNHVEIMTTDWKLNIEMSCRLMYCLYWNSDESWDIAIQKYYGGSPEQNIAYLNSVNNNMQDLFNMTITDIQ